MSRRINVLFIQSQIPFGADSLIHAHLMRHLDRSRFSVHVACTMGDGREKPPSRAAIEQIPDVTVRPTVFAPGVKNRGLAEILRLGRSSSAFPLDAVDLVRYIRTHRIDVLHGTEKPRDAGYAVGLGKLTGAKSAVHVHVKWSNECNRVARWAVGHADAVFSISDYVTGTIEAMGTPRQRIHTILNCLDASRWNADEDGHSVRAELGIEPEAPVLVSVSRLFSWKGQRELLLAAARLVPEFPTLKVLIVGPDKAFLHGGVPFSQELKALAAELGIERNVIFTGERRDVSRIMAASDVFTMPSFEEPFGVVYLEAMAMRKPVISLNNGGTPEVVHHGRAGLLSDPWDIDGLASNIGRVLRDPNLRRRMGEYGRAQVLGYFNPNRMADEAGAAYERIVAGQPAQQAALAHA